jgi:hypothetical protein
MVPDIEDVPVGIANGRYHNPIDVIKDFVIDLSGQILAHSAKIWQEFGFFLIQRIPFLDELDWKYTGGMNEFLGNQPIEVCNDLLSVFLELPASLMTFFQSLFEL